MRSGRLDTRIAIQTNTPSINSSGVAVPSWATSSTVWAEFRELKGSEFEQAQQIAAETECKFIIRHSSDVSGITNKNRIQLNSVNYDILEVIKIPGGRPRKIEILAKTRTSDA